jgi:sarcosine oxidase subunit beta
VQVTLIDVSRPGDGSSGRSVGMVETQYLRREDIEVRAFGRSAYEALERDHGLTFVHGGYLRLGRTCADTTAFEASVAAQQALGIADASVLDPQEISKRWPQIRTDDLAGGLYGSWDGYVDGYEVCQLLVSLVRRHGGRVVPRAGLLGAQRVRDGWRLDTASGVFEADVVVNAAGGWAGAVGEMLGAPVSLLPQLHGAVMVELDEPKPFTPFVMDYVPGSGVDGVYFRSERPDQLVAGLHTDEAIADPVSPDVQLGAVSRQFVERLVDLLMGRLVDVEDVAIGRSWSGIYPMTPDHRPIASRHPSADSVVCAVGAGGSGIQLAPAIGRLAADAVLGRPSSIEAGAHWACR